MLFLLLLYADFNPVAEPDLEIGWELSLLGRKFQRGPREEP